MRRPLTAAEHWRLGRRFGFPRCCTAVFSMLAVLRLAAVYRRFVGGATPSGYIPCPLCAWSRSHVPVQPGCRCLAAT